MVKPRLLKAINGVDVENMQVEEDIQIDQRYWDYVHQSMVDVVHSNKGTAVGVSQGLNYKMAGKTGTAQVISINEEEEYDSSKKKKKK